MVRLFSLVIAIFALLVGPIALPLAHATAPATDVTTTTRPLEAAASGIEGLLTEPGAIAHSATLPVTDPVTLVAVTLPAGQQVDDLLIRQTDERGTGDWHHLVLDDATVEGLTGTEPFVAVGASSVEVVALSPTILDADVHLYVAAGRPIPPAGPVAPMANPTPTPGFAWDDPQIRSRAAWGADERAVKRPYVIGPLNGAIVHHTETGNAYAREDVPRILRSIQHYHLTTRGFIDIAYNVVVDRFGRAWEGRGGGINAHIEGGHTWGETQQHMMGISALGSFMATTPPPAMVRTIENVIAWKFDINGINPHGTTSVGPIGTPAKTLRTISGHQDAVSTDCPGRLLYALLPTIRTNVATIVNQRNFAFFRDVPVGMQFRADIHWLGSRGISTGWPDGTYRPLRPVTRDAMAAFIYRLAGSPAFTPPARSPFRDVTPTSQFYKEITWMRARGLSTGWPDGTFRPTAPIARDAMAAFLYRLAGSPRYTPRTVSPFTDITPRRMHYKEMSWLYDTGLTTGYPDKTFRPLGATNRDAMAAFMHRYHTKFGN